MNYNLRDRVVLGYSKTRFALWSVMFPIFAILNIAHAHKVLVSDSAAYWIAVATLSVFCVLFVCSKGVRLGLLIGPIPAMSCAMVLTQLFIWALPWPNPSHAAVTVLVCFGCYLSIIGFALRFSYPAARNPWMEDSYLHPMTLLGGLLSLYACGMMYRSNHPDFELLGCATYVFLIVSTVAMICVWKFIFGFEERSSVHRAVYSGGSTSADSRALGYHHGENGARICEVGQETMGVDMGAYEQGYDAGSQSDYGG